MYQILLDNLKKKGISINAAATLIGMPEATFRTKAYDRSFYFEEAMIIKRNLFPELDICYLFQRDDETTEQPKEKTDRKR